MKIEEIIVKIQNSNPVALAKAITFVENRKKGYEKLLSAVHSQKKRSFKIGITGSPGSGKSTLIEKLIAELKKRKIPIGVLAFDPTSPISGGALLGDRIRMLQHSTDPNIFIRSLANRGHLGGLGRSVWEILQLLEAAGKEIIFIETVGVGQSEVEIAAVADVVLTVLTPEAGDDIQVLKAGIMEISDIFVINKSDLGGAENKLNEIRAFFTSCQKEPVVCITSAKHSQGISELISQIFEFQSSHRQDILEKDRSFKTQLTLRLVQEKITGAIAQEPELRRLLEGMGKDNPFAAAEAIYRRLISGGDDD